MSKLRLLCFRFLICLLLFLELLIHNLGDRGNLQFLYFLVTLFTISMLCFLTRRLWVAIDVISSFSKATQHFYKIWLFFNPTNPFLLTRLLFTFSFMSITLCLITQCNLFMKCLGLHFVINCYGHPVRQPWPQQR